MSIAVLGSGAFGTALANGSTAAVDDALAVRSLINGLHSRYSRTVVEQAAIAGALNAEKMSDLGVATRMAEAVAERLDAIADETERGWTGRLSTSNEGPGGFVFERTEVINQHGDVVLAADHIYVVERRN